MNCEGLDYRRPGMHGHGSTTKARQGKAKRGLLCGYMSGRDVSSTTCRFLSLSLSRRATVQKLNTSRLVSSQICIELTRPATLTTQAPLNPPSGIGFSSAGRVLHRSKREGSEAWRRLKDGGIGRVGFLFRSGSSLTTFECSSGDNNVFSPEFFSHDMIWL